MIDREILDNAAELGEIIRLHNEAVERLRAFRARRPYLIAPNLHSMFDGNLKDNIEVLYREFNNLTKPKEAIRQYVCTQCHSVFVQRLPGGICDECKSRQTSGAGRYSSPSTSIGSVYNPKEENEVQSLADSQGSSLDPAKEELVVPEATAAESLSASEAEIADDHDTERAAAT
jgi:ribosomal protein L37AE/L43A